MTTHPFFDSLRRSLPLILATALAVGCNASSQKGPDQLAKEGESSGEKNATTPEAAPQVDPTALANAAIEKLRATIDANDFDAAQRQLEELQKNEQLKLDEAQQKSLAELTDQLAARLEERTAEERTEKLADAKKLMDQGKMAEALAALNFVESHGPSDEEQTQSRKIENEIARRRQVMTSLRTWMELLGSSDRKEVRAAKAELAQEAESALPLLIAAVERGDNATVVSNSLELLRTLDKPQLTLPAMIAVLERPAQQKFWPDAIRELSRIESPGAGEPLLKLATTSQSPEQRAAALTALAEVVDPPAETLFALLPLVAKDGVELGPALNAAYNGVRVHGQFDLAALRGFETELSPEQTAALAALPARLQAIILTGSGDPPTVEAARAAMVLAIATRQVAPQPLTGVKVLRAVAELPESPASALVDGVWDSVDLKTMWRHPMGERSSVILDLGQERTVVGVRIWNVNEPNATARGWKETEVFVSNAPPAPHPIATGSVAPAPGAAAQPDYSSLISIPFARGRYIELQAKDFWKPDAVTGLSEVQVLGF